MKDLFVVAMLALLFSVACIDKDLNISFNSQDSKNYWSEVVGFENVIQHFVTSSNDPYLSVPKLEFPYRPNEEMRFMMFYDSGNQNLCKVEEGTFSPARGLTNTFNYPGSYYIKLYHPSEQMVVKVRVDSIQFSIKLLKRFKDD